MHFSLVTAFALMMPADLGEWRKVSSKDGAYSVMMPGKPQQKTIKEQTDAGPAVAHAIVSEINGITFIATGVENSARVPVDKDSPYFDNIRETVAKGAGKTLQVERRNTYKEMPYSYYRYALKAPDGQQFIVQARYIISDATHIFTLQVYIPKGVNIDDDVHKFFQSLERTEIAPKSAGKSKEKVAEKPDTKGVGPAIEAKWRSFSPPSKLISVLMPGESKREQQETGDPSVKCETYTVDLGDRSYSLVCFDFPAKITQKEPGAMLEVIVKGLAEGIKGTVAELKPVKDDGLEGREILIDFAGPDAGKPAIVRSRAYLVGTNVYVLQYSGAKGTGDRDEVVKFLESFQKSKSKPAAKAKANGRD
jgi:hypothetical protein